MGARKLGARILLHTEAEAIEIYNKNVRSVITDRGEIKTRFVVIAAGAWSPPIGETAGLNVPVRPRKGNIIVTEPIPSDDMQIVAKIHNLGLPQPSTVYSHLQRNFNVRMAFSPTPPGNILIGRSEEFAGYDTSVNYQKKGTGYFFPSLSNSFVRLPRGLRVDSNPSSLFTFICHTSVPQAILPEFHRSITEIFRQSSLNEKTITSPQLN